MIQNVDITSVHTTLDDELRKYISKKLTTLDKYLPRMSRASVRMEVKLKESKAKDKRDSMCEVVLHLPHETITVSESTINMYAAIDIVEAKLKHQILKYKDSQAPGGLRRRMLSRLARKQPAV